MLNRLKEKVRRGTSRKKELKVRAQHQPCAARPLAGSIDISSPPSPLSVLRLLFSHQNHLLYFALHQSTRLLARTFSASFSAGLVNASISVRWRRDLCISLALLFPLFLQMTGILLLSRAKEYEGMATQKSGLRQGLLSGRNSVSPPALSVADHDPKAIATHGVVTSLQSPTPIKEKKSFFGRSGASKKGKDPAAFAEAAPNSKKRLT